MYYIEVNGERSDHLGLKMLVGMERINAVDDVEEIEVLGRDGVLIRDNQRKRPIQRNFEFTVEDDRELINIEERLTEWLDFTGFKDAVLSWDDDYIYRIRPFKAFDLDEIVFKFGKLNLGFQFHPVKYWRGGRNPIEITSGDVLTNRERNIAQPTIKIEGDGDISLFINGRETRFENVQDGVIIESEKRLVHWDTRPQWQKLMRLSENDFPYFDKGENEITFTGEVTKIEVTPNWSVKL